MNLRAEPEPAAGVSPWWRTVAVALLVGSAAFLIYVRPRRPPPPPPPQEASDPRLDGRLDAVDFDRAPLGSALADLGRRAGATVEVRWDQLTVGRMDAETPVTVHLRRATVAEALDAVLRAATPPVAPILQIADDEPTWDERAGVVLVGTVGLLPAALGEPVTRVYDVRDLLAAAVAAGGSVHVGQVPTTTLSDATAELPSVVDEVTRYLTDTVRPTSWKGNGGEVGAISFWGGCLVVRQTERCQRDVAAALRSMRGGR